MRQVITARIVIKDTNRPAPITAIQEALRLVLDDKYVEWALDVTTE